MTQKWGIPELIEKAEACLDVYDFSMGSQFCQKALELEPDNAEVLFLLASIFLELCQLEEAKEILLRLVGSENSMTWVAMTMLGQITDGVESLGWYKKASERLGGASQREASSVFCCIAELYLTDLCFEPDAELSCDRFIQKAFERDQTNSEVYRLRAELCLTQSRTNEAMEAVQQVLEIWDKERGSINVREALERKDVKGVESATYDARKSIANMLVELERPNDAISIFEDLIREYDEDIMVWYSLAMTQRNAGNLELARECLETALEMASKEQPKDGELIDSMQAILRELSDDDKADNPSDANSNTENRDTFMHLE